MNTYELEPNDLNFSHSDENMLQARSCYLGGSESFAFGAPIKGLPYKYNTPFTVWCEKVGNKIKKTNPFMNYGTNNEARIRELAKSILERDYKGLCFSVFSSNKTYRLKNRPFVGANLDGFCVVNNIVEDTQELCGLEIKTGTKVDLWDNYSTPNNYECQLQHYMLVTGLKKFYIVCEVVEKVYNSMPLSGKSRVYIARVVKANPIFQKALLDKYVDFWENYVLKKVSPELSGDSCENPYLKFLPHKYVGQEIGILTKNYHDIKDSITRLTKELSQVRDELNSKYVCNFTGNFLVVNDYKITKSLMTSYQVNHAELSRENPELYNKHVNKNQINFFTVRKYNKEGSF